MNSSKRDTTNPSKDNQNLETKQSSDTNKHSNLNTKEVSKTTKEVKKLIFNQITRSLNRKPTPHNTKPSNAKDNIKMFKNYFESKINKTIKKLNQTMNQQSEMHSLPITAAKPSENNSFLDKSSVPFSHRPVDSVEITLHKKQHKLKSNKEPLNTQKDENKNSKNGNKAKTHDNTKISENISLTDENNFTNKKNIEIKSEGNNLKQAIKNVNCLNKIKKAFKTNATIYSIKMLNIRRPHIVLCLNKSVTKNRVNDAYNEKNKPYIIIPYWVETEVMIRA